MLIIITDVQTQHDKDLNGKNLESYATNTLIYYDVTASIVFAEFDNRINYSVFL